MDKRMAIIKITPELLERSLHIKNDALIINMFQTDSDKMSGIFSATLTGVSKALYSVPEGSVIPIIPITDIQEDDNGQD